LVVALETNIVSYALDRAHTENLRTMYSKWRVGPRRSESRGLEQKTRVATVGNSLAVRIPKRLANFLGLRRGVEVLIHPMGRDKLVIEETSDRS